MFRTIEHNYHELGLAKARGCFCVWMYVCLTKRISNGFPLQLESVLFLLDIICFVLLIDLLNYLENSL